MNKAILLLGLLTVSFATSRVGENNAADALQKQIQDMSNAIEVEQGKHDTLHSEQEGECIQEIGFRNSEVKDAQDAFAASQLALNNCSTAQAGSNVDLTKAQNYSDSIDTILVNLVAQRAHEKEAFETLINDEIEPAIRSIQGVYPILSEFSQQAVSFVQFSAHLNKVFTQMVKVNKAPQFGDILAVLLQVPSFQHGISNDTIDELSSLFDKLLQDLKTAKADAETNEEDAIIVYNTTVDSYNAILGTLANTISQLTGYIGEMQTCIDNETSISDSASAKEKRNTDALNNAIDMCDAFDIEYTNATSSRNDELELLRKLKTFVREQADIFGDFGNDGVDAFKEYQKSFAETKSASRSNFLQKSLKNYKKSGLSGLTAGCAGCRGFIQKKLGF